MSKISKLNYPIWASSVFFVLNIFMKFLESYFLLKTCLIKIDHWNSNCNRPLTYSTLAKLFPANQSNITSGLESKVFEFLNANGYINCGLNLSSRNDFRRKTQIKNVKTIVIGAGLSGLMAANHLKRYGIQVKIIEAKVFIVDC